MKFFGRLVGTAQNIAFLFWFVMSVKLQTRLLGLIISLSMFMVKIPNLNTILSGIGLSAASKGHQGWILSHQGTNWLSLLQLLTCATNNITRQQKIESMDNWIFWQLTLCFNYQIFAYSVLCQNWHSIIIIFNLSKLCIKVVSENTGFLFTYVNYLYYVFLSNLSLMKSLPYVIPIFVAIFAH